MDGYTKPQHQAAGHDGALVDSSGAIFIKPSTDDEIAFYTTVQEHLEQEDKDEESKLTDWMPLFLGTLQPGISQGAEKTQQVTDDIKQLEKEQIAKGIVDPTKKYLVIQNLLHGFKKPAIIDIKLGAILYDDKTSDEKKKRLEDVSRTTTSGSLHYRVCGMKLYGTTIPDLSCFNDVEEHVVKDEDGYIVFDKWYGRSLTLENISENFKIFFCNNDLPNEIQQIVIRNTFTRLQLLYNCLLSEEVRIRSGSILLAFENDVDRWKEMQNEDPIFKDDLPYDDNDDDDENTVAPLSLLSLIDFAHAKFTPGQGHDEDIVVGVENLMNVVEGLITV